MQKVKFLQNLSWYETGDIHFLEEEQAKELQAQGVVEFLENDPVEALPVETEPVKAKPVKKANK
jgi:hypothetical protein